MSRKVALIAGNRLGDGLILRVMAHNLEQNGYEVTLYNTPLLTLRNLFPRADIRPNFPVQESETLLKEYDLLIYQHGDKHAKTGASLDYPHLVLYGKPLYMKKKSLIDIYMDCLKKVFYLPLLQRSNGMGMPPSSVYRKYKKRVIIHPTSLRPEKNWPEEKFLSLARKIKEKGYEVQFTVSPNEKKNWDHVEKKGFPLVLFERLDDLAAYLHESGYMIGNDSGIAHLASNLRIPTLVLFIRPGVAKRWKPGFFPSEAVLPRIHLPGPKLKELFWKKMIGVPQVYRRFCKLVKKYP